MGRDFNDDSAEMQPTESGAGTHAAAYVTRATLFERLKSGESQTRELAWSEFMARYAPAIAGFAKRCGATRQDIDDIVQDVITGFYSISGEFAYDPAKGRFRGWLKTCTVRAAIRRAGKNLRFGGVPLEAVPEIELAVEPLWNDVWEEQLVTRALRVLRETADDSLAFRAFEQYVLLDRPAEDVARDLGTTVANVHQSKSRMTKRLRGIVGELREGEE
jgi:RNA polymerase sigma-70 factor (ECF subfamily)